MPSQIPLPMELTPSIVPMPPPKPISILKKDTMYKVCDDCIHIFYQHRKYFFIM